MDANLRERIGLAAVPFAPLSDLAQASGAVVVDLRSPSEYVDDHAPGAVNVPLFDDEDRALVGLLYRQFSPEAAFQEGRAAVARRVEELVTHIAEVASWQPVTDDLPARVLAMTEGGIARLDVELSPFRPENLPARPVVLYCWRGGLRSRSVVALLRALGLSRAVGLDGGYRAWRRHAMDRLAAWEAPPRVVALRGLTGVGKTLVLRAIERKRPGWTLDLEGAAGHRSSLLGMVGLDPRSQKAFETALVERQERGFPGGVLVVEGESRKVGDAIIPVRIWEALAGATNVLLETDVARRVEVLSEDYLARTAALPRLREQLIAVAERMPGAPDLVGLFDAGRTTELVELLLESYYDPLYRHSERDKEYALRVDAGDEERAADEIVHWIETAS